MKKIVDQWAIFAERVIPANAGSVQKNEMKKAFFAGFDSAMVIMQQIGELSTEKEGLEAVTLLDKEIAEFVEEINKFYLLIICSLPIHY